ncbi:MAG: helix-turn-helix domain-containing protein [Oligoflexia bacterium]|nr:helix-turn-helix domain-containing protein [Oligoflexia bacterium]
MNHRRTEDGHNSDLKNYYEILEIDYDASQEQIYEGYVRAKNTYSGDGLALYSVMTKEECDTLYEMIEAAYSVLSVPHKRKEYDLVKGIFSLREQKYQATTQASTQASAATPESDSSSLHYPDHNHTHNFEHFHGGEDSRYFLDEINGLEHNLAVGSLHGPHKKIDSPPKSNKDFQKDFQINRHEADVSRLSAPKRFGLNYTPDPQFDQEIESVTKFTGPLLKKIREYKNVSIERMCDLTKISRTYIKGIEEENISKLPALTYVRGFVYQYAKCLRLDPNIVATSYINNIKELKKNA